MDKKRLKGFESPTFTLGTWLCVVQKSHLFCETKAKCLAIDVLDYALLRINQSKLQVSLQKVYTWLVQNHGFSTDRRTQSFDSALIKYEAIFFLRAEKSATVCREVISPKDIRRAIAPQAYQGVDPFLLLTSPFQLRSLQSLFCQGWHHLHSKTRCPRRYSFLRT